MGREATGDGREPGFPEPDGFLTVESLLVKAFLEAPEAGTRPQWHGYLTHVASGRRAHWRTLAELQASVGALLGELEAAAAGPPPGIATMSAPALSQVLGDMLSHLEPKLPPAPPPLSGLPNPNVTVTAVAERPVGIGNHAGAVTRGPLTALAVKGGRLDAIVRFQVWDDSPTDVDDAILQLQSDVIDDLQQLEEAGFLRIEPRDTTLAENVPGVGWRKTTSYEVLFEYSYEESDDATGLIARIPVHTDPETADSPEREDNLLTDEMARWDDEDAPDLTVEAPLIIRKLSALAWLDANPTGSVTLLRTHDGAAGAPVDHPDLAAFAAATGGESPTDRHARIVFASPQDFLAQLAAPVLVADLPQVGLGDFDEDLVVDQYAAADFRFDPPIHLVADRDRLELAHQNPQFDQKAVIYLRFNAP